MDHLQCVSQGKKRDFLPLCKEERTKGEKTVLVGRNAKTPPSSSTRYYLPISLASLKKGHPHPPVLGLHGAQGYLGLNDVWFRFVVAFWNPKKLPCVHLV